MKIPETAPNVGAYYGNEESGQWQVLGEEGFSQQDSRLIGLEQSVWADELARLKSEAKTLKRRIRNAAPIRRQKVVDEYLEAKEKYETLAKMAQMVFCEDQDDDVSLPNGVIIDSGVGGGVVGSGDAGIHRPPVYPVHIPRAHMPGYVMAGAYYPPAPYPPVPTQPQPDDFADYMWMENEEEFDKQVMQQLEEEALMEQCIEAMLEDEQRERTCRNNRTHNGHNHHHYPTTSNGGPSLSLEETVSRSTLNPLAAEFVPTRLLPAATDERQDPPPAPSPAPPPTDHTETEQTDSKTEEPLPPQTDPPEVSAADTIERRPKDKNSKTKVEVKKQAVKQEVKSKSKPAAVKSETKVAKKKEGLVKTVRSEIKVEEFTDEVAVVPELKPQPTPVEPQETQPTSGFKPINYAAAAKANKPKKPTTTTIDTKPQTQPKIEKKVSEKIDNKKDKLKQKKLTYKGRIRQSRCFLLFFGFKNLLVINENKDCPLYKFSGDTKGKGICLKSAC